MTRAAILIEPLRAERSGEVQTLLTQCFPWQKYLPLGQISLRFILLKESCARIRPEKKKSVKTGNFFLGRLLEGFCYLVGIEDSFFWLAISKESSQVLGIIGLYGKTADAHEAYWVDWFCVAPDARSQGVGAQLIEFCIEYTQRSGKKYLRLETSTDPNEVSAQILYEKYGLYIIEASQPWYWSLLNISRIVRERECRNTVTVGAAKAATEEQV